MVPLLATAATAQGVTTLVLQGDNIPGVGNVTSIDNIWINSAGQHLVQVTTDNANANADQAVLKDGALFLREGQALAQPAGATIKSFGAMCLNDNGDAVFALTLNGTGGTSNDSGVYWNSTLVLQEGTFSTSPLLSSQTPYIEFNQVRCNDNNQILIIGAVDDGTIASASDACIVLLDTNGSGVMTGETVLRLENDPAGTGSNPTTLFAGQAHYYDFNNAGQVMTQVYMATGSGANDVAVYLDTTLLAEEAAPSPIAGRNWGNLSAPAMGVNNNGDWAMKGFLDGSNTDNQIILKNDVKVVQKGDVLTATGGFRLVSLGLGPVEVADNGSVLWYGDWDDTNTSKDTGYFVDLDLKVQEGVTTVGSATIKSLSFVADGYHMSPSGGFIIFEAVLDNNLSGAFMIGAGEPGTPMCFGDLVGGNNCPCGNFGNTGQGCQNSTLSGAVLGAAGSPSLTAANLGFQVSGLAPFKPSLLVSNTVQQVGIFGDGLSCVGGSLTHHGVRWAGGAGSVSWDWGQMSNQNWSAAQDYYFQAIYRDNVGPCGGTFNASSAYKVSFIP
jgi:hypothetical protein